MKVSVSPLLALWYHLGQALEVLSFHAEVTDNPRGTMEVAFNDHGGSNLLAVVILRKLGTTPSRMVRIHLHDVWGHFQIAYYEFTHGERELAHTVECQFIPDALVSSPLLVANEIANEIAGWLYLPSARVRGVERRGFVVLDSAPTKDPQS